MVLGTWDLEMQMIRIERKHGYKSRSYERFKRFKQRYYDLFEDVLFENGYMLSDIPNIFYNYFRPWYEHKIKAGNNKPRIEVINWFLSEYEV